MNILDIVNRTQPSHFASEEYVMPWHKEDFSRRALREYLNQEHDAASQKLELMQNQIEWIHHNILKDKISKILDLSCGPGIYTNMLAKFGHHCKGIDISPAGIEYARITKTELMLDCEYQLGDIRSVDYGKGFDMVMNLYGEFNNHTKADASKILKSINAALVENGLLLLELYPFDTIEEIGNKEPTWTSSEESRFSSKPHLILTDYEWNPGPNFSVERYYIVHSENVHTEMYTNRLQAYSIKEYEDLFEKNGFAMVNKFPAIASEKYHAGAKMFTLLLKKIA